MLTKKQIIIPICLSWVSLGIKRGVDYYDHSNPSIYLYKNRLFAGFMGGIIYANPFLSLIVINKELYRLEILVRNMEEERTKTTYYDFY